MARTPPPSDDPTPNLKELEELNDMAFEAEQFLADVIAISKLASEGLSDSPHMTFL
jgi:hypothetical protein